jgi:NADH-quinone oxidoreductase subunit F
MEPLMSAIKYFRPEFDQKIAQAVGVDVIDAAANQQPVVK